MLAAAAASVLLAIAWWWPLPAQALRSTIAHPYGDPLLNMWTLGWGADRLRHGFAGLWDAPFFYPYRDTLAYSEHLLGISLFTAPLQWLTGNPVLVFNVAMVASTALCAFGMFLLARELTGRSDAACVAAVIFACAPYRAAQIYHLQVLTSGWMPLTLLGLHLYFRTGQRRALWLFGGAFVLQALSNGYFLYFTFVPAAIVTVHELVRQRHALRRHLVSLALVSAGVLAALAPVALAYVRVRREQGLVRAAGDLALYSPPLEAYGQVVAHLWLWGPLLPTGRQEFELFPGLLALLLALVAVAALVVTPRSRGLKAGDSGGEQQKYTSRGAHRLDSRQMTRLYLVITLAAVALSLGPFPTAFGWTSPVAGPFAWVSAVLPGMDGLRVPARMATVVTLGLAALAAIGLGRMTSRLGVVTRRSIAAALTLVAAAEGYGGPPPLEAFPSASMASEDEAYAWLARQPRGPLLELPVGDAFLATRHQYRTLAHGHPIVNGYSGYGSALQVFLGGPPFTEVARIDESLHAVRTIGLRWIVVHPELYEHPVAGAALADAMAASSGHVRRVERRGGLTILELRPLAPETVAIPDPTDWRELTPDRWQAEASHQPALLPQAFDGVRATRWATAERQQGREWLVLRFDRPLDVAKVRLELDGRSFGDYPRGLVVEGRDDEGPWRGLDSDSVLARFVASLVREPLTPGIDILLPPNRTRELRLRTTGETRAWFWAIHELRVWER